MAVNLIHSKENPAGRLDRRLLIAGILALIAILLALAVFRGQIFGSGAATKTDYLTAGELESQYGLRVHLVALTAAGGLIDVRLKVLDAAKATPLLESAGFKPELIVKESGTVLKTQDTSQQDIKLEDGQMYFILLPNSGHALDRGSEAILKFGDLLLEPVNVL